MSAFARTTDSSRTSRHVRIAPTTDLALYSITSSARASSVVGTVRPSAFAVAGLLNRGAR